LREVIDAAQDAEKAFLWSFDFNKVYMARQKHVKAVTRWFSFSNESFSSGKYSGTVQ